MPLRHYDQLTTRYAHFACSIPNWIKKTYEVNETHTTDTVVAQSFFTFRPPFIPPTKIGNESYKEVNRVMYL